jgi:hypothetical protein
MNGPTVHPQVSPGEIVLTWNTEELAKEPFPVPLRPPQIALGLIRARTRDSETPGTNCPSQNTVLLWG